MNEESVKIRTWIIIVVVRPVKDHIHVRTSRCDTPSTDSLSLSLSPSLSLSLSQNGAGPRDLSESALDWMSAFIMTAHPAIV